MKLQQGMTALVTGGVSGLGEASPSSWEARMAPILARTIAR